MVILIPCRNLLKPAFVLLHASGYESSVYFDGSLFSVDTLEEYYENVLSTRSLLQELRFVIHKEESIFTSSQKILFLGFEIDKINIILTLTSEKKKKLKKENFISAI